MSPWIIPALKAILPHVGDIVSAAKPMFTRTKTNERADAQNDFATQPNDAPVQQQIAELQAVAAQNDAHIRELAEQLQAAVTALEAAALLAQAKSQQLRRLCTLSLGIAVLAIAMSFLALLNP